MAAMAIAKMMLVSRKAETIPTGAIGSANSTAPNPSTVTSPPMPPPWTLSAEQADGVPTMYEEQDRQDEDAIEEEEPSDEGQGVGGQPGGLRGDQRIGRGQQAGHDGGSQPALEIGRPTASSRIPAVTAAIPARFAALKRSPSQAMPRIAVPMGATPRVPLAPTGQREHRRTPALFSRGQGAGRPGPQKCTLLLTAPRLIRTTALCGILIVPIAPAGRK